MSERFYPIVDGGSHKPYMPGTDRPYSHTQVPNEPGAIHTGDVPVINGVFPRAPFSIKGPQVQNETSLGAQVETPHDNPLGTVRSGVDTQAPTNEAVDPAQAQEPTVEGQVIPSKVKSPNRTTLQPTSSAAPYWLSANVAIMTNKPEQRSNKQKQQGKVEIATGTGIILGEVAAIALGVGMSINPPLILLGIVGLTGAGIYCLIDGIRNMKKANKDNKAPGLHSQTGQLENRHAEIKEEDDKRAQRFISAVHLGALKKRAIAVFPHLEEWINKIRPQK